MPSFTTDVPCPSCGYNLRGLSLGHGCPECGLKVVSTDVLPEVQLERKRLEAEIAENLRKMGEDAAHQERLVKFLLDWENRGERLDRLLDRVEKLLEKGGDPAGG
jgi:hypothetical protein